MKSKLPPTLLKFLILFAILAAGAVIWSFFPTGDVSKDGAARSATPAPAATPSQSVASKVPQAPAAPAAPANAAWNTAATPQGFAAAAKADLNAVPPKPGDPLPAHLNKLWPQGTFLSQTDRVTPLGTERVSIVQPAALPYPIRIQEYYPKNGDPVLVSEVIADRILVGKPDAMSHDKFATILSGVGAAKVKRLTEGGVYQLIFETVTADTVPGGVRTLQTRFPVAYAEADPVQRGSITPNDPLYLSGATWGLHNTGQDAGTADADIDAPEAWDVRTSAENIVVGVIDSGVLYTHEDLAANMWTNPGESGGGKETNGLDDDNNGYVDDVYGINSISDSGDPKDDHGHGSHCSGTIAGVGNNGLGVAGVAWRAKIMGLKFLSSEGSGALSDAVECLEYARLMGANLTSNSWGGGAPSDAMKSAISDAVAAGQLFVVAAGNETNNNDNTPTYPTNYPVSGIVSVAATDRTDAIASFSNYGIGTVHIGAPGVTIQSLGITSNSAYSTMSGTSMATPHVAGVVAMLMAQFPTDAPGQILNRLFRSADPIPSLTDNAYTGARLNLRQALTTTSNAPFNDDFAQARAFTSNELNLQTTLHSATAEISNISDGIANGPAVWFRISIPAAGNVVLTTADSSFDTLLGVYTGSSITALTTVATNDDSGGITSSVSFDAAANTDYYVAIAGKSGQQGFLRLAMTGPVANDDLANAYALNVMGGDGFGGRNTTATKEPGEANHAGNAGGKSVWAKFTAPVTGYYTATTGGEASPEITSSFDTLLAVYAGPATNPTHAQLVPVASNDDDPCGYFQTSLLGFHATAGQTYYLAVDGRSGASGDIRFLVFPMGDHDYFATAMPLNGDEHTINTSNRIATAEAFEPAPGGNQPRNTLWYDFVPATSGTFEVDTVVTLGSRTAHNTYLAVYTGTALDSLTEVAADVLESASNYGFDSLLTFTATAGQHYKIVTGLPGNFYAPLLGPSGLRIRKVEPILNDAFADAITVPSPAGRTFSTLTGKNRGATVQTGEPLTEMGFGNPPQNTVWWKWTADRTTRMQVNTVGSSFDTVLWVYTGNSVNALTEIAFADEGGESFTSVATFTPVIGTTYYFRVAGWNNASGNVTLNLGEDFTPGDKFVDAFVVDPNLFYQSYSNGPATLESGEPFHAGVATQSRSLWYKFTATAETAGPVAFSTQGSQDTVVGVYTGTAVNALTPVTSNDDYSGRLQAEVSWTAVAGTTYHIAVALGFEGGTPTPYCITFQPVRYNAFASALTLAGDTHSVTAHNFGTTKESGEPAHAGNSGGRSIWFNWTPATSGTFRVSTVGSNVRILSGGPQLSSMDTLLGVYTGTAVNALTTVASNDNYGYSGSGLASEVYFAATAGTTYRIAVDGKNATGMTGGDWGQIKLGIAPFTRPANDSFASAEVISSASLPFIQNVDLDNFGATTEASEPTHAGNTSRSKGTLWYRFTAPETRTYFASTAGNLYNDDRARNTVVAVYTGSSVGALTAIASNAEGLGLGHSEAGFAATAGTTYHIAIGAQYAGPMSFLLVPAPANNNFAAATQAYGSNFSAIGYNVGANAEAGELDPYAGDYMSARTGTRRSVWWKWTAPVSGTYTVDTYNSDLWAQLSIHSAAGGVSAEPLWVQNGVVSDPLNYTVTGNRDLEDRRARGTMTTSFSFVAGTTYYFRVAGGGFTNDHAGTIRLDVSGPPAIPPAPLALNATRSSSTSVLLTWQDLSNDETAYVLERSTDGSTWSALATLPANTVNYLDAGTPATDLHYRLKATNTLGSSAWATALSTVPAPPLAPANFTATGTSTTSVQLTWNTVANATALRLERSTTGNLGPWTLVSAALSGNATSYSDTGLTGGTSYWYRLRASNVIGNGPWSAVAATATSNTQALVSDPFTDGGITNGTDPLDVAWSKTGNIHTVVTDATLDPASPNNVSQFSISAADKDEYIFFTLPGGNQTLAVGESLKVSFKLRHTGTPRTDNSRTGFSLAYTPTSSAWSNPDNREYLVRPSYGSSSNIANIARSSGAQAINSSATELMLANNLGCINAGTNAFAVWMEVARTGESTVVIRYQLGDGSIQQATDTGAANGTNSGIITTFNRVFFRFRTVASAATPAFLIDDVVVTKAVAGTPAPSQHPITAWRTEHFGISTNTGNAADTLDFDGDGIPNLLEYALDSLPDSAADAVLPELGTAEVTGQDRLTLGFTPVETAGLRYIIEASSDLSDWSDASDITALLTPGQPYLHTDSANLGTTTRRFLRLRVEVE